MSTHHVVWENETIHPPLTVLPTQQMWFHCKHCGDRFVLVLPASLPMAAACMRAFGAEHRGCPAPAGAAAAEGAPP